MTSTGEDGNLCAATTWKLQRSGAGVAKSCKWHNIAPLAQLSGILCWPPAAAFYDGPMLLTSLNVVKNFVLLGDVQHSVQFVRYRDEVGGWLGGWVGGWQQGQWLCCSFKH